MRISYVCTNITLSYYIPTVGDDVYTMHMHGNVHSNAVHICT